MGDVRRWITVGGKRVPVKDRDRPASEAEADACTICKKPVGKHAFRSEYDAVCDKCMRRALKMPPAPER
jgi:hypothetical protein